MKNIFVLTHNSEISGPIDYFQRYLETNNYKIIRLEHPLDNYKNRFTVFRDEQGQTTTIKRVNYLSIFNLFIDFFLSIKFIIKNNFAIFVGANNFDTLAGIISRKIFFKKINKIIYFGSDFSEDRFHSIILNKLYYLIEAICCKYADTVISNTERAEGKRLSFGLKKGKSLVVPNGVLLDEENFEEKELNNNNFIFVGSVTREHGLYDLIQIIRPLINRLVLIGRGNDWDRVINLCKDNNIKTEIYFRKDHSFCISYMRKFNGFGLAPYNTDSKWTYYCSPLKVFEYIACGLPVIMSSLPEIAKNVAENKLGVVYDELNFNKINKDLEVFDLQNFFVKAKNFYSIYNQNSLYKKIKL